MRICDLHEEGQVKADFECRNCKADFCEACQYERCGDEEFCSDECQEEWISKLKPEEDWES